MNDKRKARLRRARKTRANIRRLDVTRLSVYRTPRHFYAQVMSADGSSVLASASTLDAEVRKEIKNSGNIDAAKTVGTKLAERASKSGIDTVAFDRSGFKYHGRIAAFADAAREAGLKF
jgi:large subunit ribosomal protein L18